MAKKKGMNLYMRTKLPHTAQVIKQLGVDSTGRVQKFVTDEIFSRLIDYIPMKSGALRASARKLSPTRIKVGGVGLPYTRAQFFGVTKDGKPFDYDKAAGAKVGAHWDRRLTQNEGAQIVNEANMFVKGKK